MVKGNLQAQEKGGWGSEPLPTALCKLGWQLGQRLRQGLEGGWGTPEPEGRPVPRMAGGGRVDSHLFPTVTA